MTIAIILTTLFSIFIFANNADLCADVYVDATEQPVTDSTGQTLNAEVR